MPKSSGGGGMATAFQQGRNLQQAKGAQTPPPNEYFTSAGTPSSSFIAVESDDSLFQASPPSSKHINTAKSPKRTIEPHTPPPTADYASQNEKSPSGNSVEKGVFPAYRQRNDNVKEAQGDNTSIKSWVSSFDVTRSFRTVTEPPPPSATTRRFDNQDIRSENCDNYHTGHQHNTGNKSHVSLYVTTESNIAADRRSLSSEDSDDTPDFNYVEVLAAALVWIATLFDTGSSTSIITRATLDLLLAEGAHISEIVIPGGLKSYKSPLFAELWVPKKYVMLHLENLQIGFDRTVKLKILENSDVSQIILGREYTTAKQVERNERANEPVDNPMRAITHFKRDYKDSHKEAKDEERRQKYRERENQSWQRLYDAQASAEWSYKGSASSTHSSNQSGQTRNGGARGEFFPPRNQNSYGNRYLHEGEYTADLSPISAVPRPVRSTRDEMLERQSLRTIAGSSQYSRSSIRPSVFSRQDTASTTSSAPSGGASKPPSKVFFVGEK
ncbi:hypothetical protein HYALB_00001003 [Hymenoscyphus albidus]|uniref:Uncharacterized protein n=1 Tax=Hymenoscyphus albidus TaxID=595503 RepID=A0A9N9LZS4_9HELO|nr:hypothetical protein HYALB_00001003 [Hymenoscyphus albidus]